MLPAHERRRLKQMQSRMSQKSQPSEANRRLNAQLDKQRKGDPHGDPISVGSQQFVFGSGTTNQDPPADRSVPQQGRRDYGGTVRRPQGSRFAALADDQAAVVQDLDKLKQRIQNITYGPPRPGHEKARIKLEKGRSSTSGPRKTGPVSASPSRGSQAIQRPAGPSSKGGHGSRVNSSVGSSPLGVDSPCHQPNSVDKGKLPATQPHVAPISISKTTMLPHQASSSDTPEVPPPSRPLQNPVQKGGRTTSTMDIDTLPQAQSNLPSPASTQHMAASDSLRPSTSVVNSVTPSS